MEELLCDAAIKGDRVLLHQIIAEDEYILDKVSVGTFKGKNPLHVAISTGKEEFVAELLRIKPSLAEVLDMELGSALHIASAKGNLKIVKDLVTVSPKMCLARDRDGNNPLHIAAMNGKVDVLEELIQTDPQRAKVKMDRGDTTLHLCVKYDQFQCLKLLLDKIPDREFVNDVDSDGNTILHLAFFEKQWEMIRHVLDKNNCKIDVNAKNKSGLTAQDIHLQIGNPERADSVHEEIKGILLRAEAKPGKERLVERPWVTKRRDAFMIVASLIATIEFQVGVNPPGGVWQDDSKEHQAGKAILAYKYPISYKVFMFVNTVGFLWTLSLISFFVMDVVGQTRFDRVAPALVCWVTLMPTAFAYTYSVISTFPEDNDIEMMRIKIIVITWAAYVTLVLLGSCLFHRFLEVRLKLLEMRLKLIGWLRSRRNAAGENQSNLDDVVIHPPQAALVSGGSMASSSPAPTSPLSSPPSLLPDGVSIFPPQPLSSRVL